MEDGQQIDERLYIKQSNRGSLSFRVNSVQKE